MTRAPTNLIISIYSLPPQVAYSASRSPAEGAEADLVLLTTLAQTLVVLLLTGISGILSLHEMRRFICMERKGEGRV